MRNKFVYLPLILGLCSVQLSAENEPVTIADFNNLIGHWRGDGLGGVCEETWLPESGGSMLGTFKLIKGDQVAFFEIMNITIDSIGPALRVKHFNADMTGWEDKAEMVTFRYDSSSSGQHYFGGLRFLMPAADSLVIGVTFKSSDGSKHEEHIKCQKVAID